MEVSNAPIQCWFCLRRTQHVCRCGRGFCATHGFGDGCIVCALGFGLFEQEGKAETLSANVIYSLSAAARDPYIVVTAGLREAPPMPVARLEALLSTLLQMLKSADLNVARRAAAVLASATNSWATMNPSRLATGNYGTSLIAIDQVRVGLLNVLKQARARSAEPLALAILEKLRSADFRNLYPSIEEQLKVFSTSSKGTRVSQVFEAIMEFYPSASYAANEQVELMVYEQYTNRQTGAGEIMERIWGHRVRFEPALVKIFKKGLWHTRPTLFLEWYPGEDEPV